MTSLSPSCKALRAGSRAGGRPRITQVITKLQDPFAKISYAPSEVDRALRSSMLTDRPRRNMIAQGAPQALKSGGKATFVLATRPPSSPSYGVPREVALHLAH